MAKTLSLVRNYMNTDLVFKKNHKLYEIESDKIDEVLPAKRLVFKNLNNNALDSLLEYVLFKEVLELQFINCEIERINLTRFCNLIDLTFYGVNMSKSEVCLPLNSKIKFLTLEHCALDFIPVCFLNINDLKSLRIAHNKFSKIEFNNELNNSLEYLDIRNNKFKRIPENICLMKNLKGLLIDARLLSIENMKIIESRIPDILIDRV